MSLIRIAIEVMIPAGTPSEVGHRIIAAIEDLQHVKICSANAVDVSPSLPPRPHPLPPPMPQPPPDGLSLSVRESRTSLRHTLFNERLERMREGLR